MAARQLLKLCVRILKRLDGYKHLRNAARNRESAAKICKVDQKWLSNFNFDKF